jgi:CRISPR-associated protein Cas2
MDRRSRIVRANAIEVVDMAQTTLWYLVSYDIREPKRWRRAYKILRGYGRPLQYSVFRCKLGPADIEKLRWELERVLDAEDSLMFIGLCSSCVDRISARNRDGVWEEEEVGFSVA